MNDLLKLKRKQLQELEEEIKMLSEQERIEKQITLANESFNLFNGQKWLLVRNKDSSPIVKLIKVHHLVILGNNCYASASEIYEISEYGYYHKKFTKEQSKSNSFYNGIMTWINAKYRWDDLPLNECFIPDEVFIKEFKRFIMKQLKPQVIKKDYCYKTYEFQTNIQPRSTGE